VIDRKSYLAASQRDEALAIESLIARESVEALSRRRTDLGRGLADAQAALDRLADAPARHGSFSDRQFHNVDLKVATRLVAEIEARLTITRGELERRNESVMGAIRRSNAASQLLDALRIELEQAESAEAREAMRADTKRRENSR